MTPLTRELALSNRLQAAAVSKFARIHRSDRDHHPGLASYVASGYKTSPGSHRHGAVCERAHQKVGTVEIRSADRPLKLASRFIRLSAEPATSDLGRPKAGRQPGLGSRVKRDRNPLAIGTQRKECDGGSTGWRAFNDLEIARAVVFHSQQGWCEVPANRRLLRRQNSHSTVDLRTFCVAIFPF